MTRSRYRPALALLVFLPNFLVGCQSTATRAAPLGERLGMVLPDLSQPPQTDIVRTSAVASIPPASFSDEQLPDVGELSESFLIEQVLARNPSLAQMTAVWRAARARYPQVVSFDDPMFGFVA